MAFFSAPPIPRGRIPLARPPKSSRKGLFAAIACVGVLIICATLYGKRDSLVAAWPPIDRLYASLGLGAPVIGEALVIQNLACLA